MKVLFLNGPPRCGKDSVGRMLNEASPFVRVVKFAHALKVATHALFAGLQGRLPVLNGDGKWRCVDPYAVNKLCLSEHYEHDKDKPHEDFMGETPRQAYIAVSEMLCKPFLGPHIFGHLLAETMQRCDSPGTVWVVTDCGFPYELKPIISLYGPDRCMLVTITREGCTYDGDSRRYIAPEEVGLRATSIDNSGTLDQLAEQVQQLERFMPHFMP